MGSNGREDRAQSAETLAAQALGGVDPVTGAIVPPIDITTTYERGADNSYPLGHVYARPHNATAERAEAVIGALEGGPVSLLVGSGMAAATTAFLALGRPAHVVAPRVMYWALRHWLAGEGPAHGLTADFVDMTDLDAVAAAVRPGETRMIWLEVPANPLWDVADIAAVASIAREAGALLGVDSTVATPVLTRPLAHGADLVMHSATKYLNGHSDVLAGALVAARDDDYAARLRSVRAGLGAILGPFEAALLLRGLRTLHVRVRHQSASALALARHLDAHPAVAQVLYPGLQSHPQHGVACRQMQGGFSGMLSVRVKGGEAAAIAAASRLKVFKRATSLGGVESLVEHRASVEGPDTPCPPDLLRLSVGLEAVDDLIADWDRALG